MIDTHVLPLKLMATTRDGRAFRVTMIVPVREHIVLWGHRTEGRTAVAWSGSLADLSPESRAELEPIASAFARGFEDGRAGAQAGFWTGDAPYVAGYQSGRAHADVARKIAAREAEADRPAGRIL